MEKFVNPDTIAKMQSDIKKKAGLNTNNTFKGNNNFEKAPTLNGVPIGSNDLNGTNYIMVYGVGTPTENAAEFEESFNKAVLLNPTLSNIISIIVAPGDYGNPIIPEIEGVIIKSLTGLDDVIINGVARYGINKSSVGLENVDNTSDANKPVSIAQQAAINLVANSFPNRQEPVANVEDLATTYPTAASDGTWAAIVTSVGFIYCKNASGNWVSTGLTAFPEDVATTSNIQFGTFIEDITIKSVDTTLEISIHTNSIYGNICYAVRNGFTQVKLLLDTYVLNNWDKLVWNLKTNDIYIIEDAIQVKDYELILLQPVFANDNKLEIGMLANKYKYTNGYYEFYKLQDENSLIIDFQSKNAANSNQRFLSFKFNGEFTIQSGITGIKNSFLWEDFLETFANLIDNGLIAIPYGRKISYNFTSGELVLRYSYLDVARDEFILLDNWLPYPEALGISNNNIRGYFADIYYKKAITLEDYLEGLKRPDFYWHKELEDKLNLISSELNSTDFIFTATTDMHVSVANRNNYHLLNWGIVNYIHEKINPKFHIDLGDSIYQSSPLLNKTLGLTNIRTAASLFNCKNKMFVIGNHDYNSMPELNPNESFYFSDKEIFNSIGRNINTDVVWGSKEKIYYYKDFIEEKIRVIVLNTTQNTPSFDISGEMTSLDPMDYPVIQQNQVDWFANIALDFSDKTDKTEWHTIIFSHISPSPINDDTPRCENAKDDNNVIYDLINAFKNAGTVNYNHVDLVQNGMATVSITKSFVSQGQMNLIGCISGHTHYEANYDYNGIIFRTLLAGHNYETVQIPHTSNATSVPFIAINKENRTLKIRYFGYGENLNLSY